MDMYSAHSEPAHSRPGSRLSTHSPITGRRASSAAGTSDDAQFASFKHNPASAGIGAFDIEEEHEDEHTELQKLVSMIRLSDGRLLRRDDRRFKMPCPRLGMSCIELAHSKIILLAQKKIN